MKALTVKQPWASLIASGAKRYETRSWQCQYRGPILITASRIFETELQELSLSEPFFSAIAWQLDQWNRPRPELSLPAGRALCIVDLIAIHRTTDMAEKILADDFATERAFGDFRNGRFAWELENPRLLTSPVEVRGQVGLFDMPDHIIEPYLTATSQ